MKTETVESEVDQESQLVPEFMQVPVFSVHERIITWEMVLSTTGFLGNLNDVVSATLTARQAANIAIENGETIDAGAAQELANQIRYHHNLITAEETATWLETRHMSLADLNDFVAATLLGGHADATSVKVAKAELAHLLWVEVNLRDLWPVILPSVARRYLVEELRLNEQTFKPSFLDDARAAFHERQADSDSMAPFIGDALEELLKREASYLQYCDLVTSEEACQKKLASMRPELYFVDFELAYFDLHDVVREAYLCISVDGEPMDALCDRAGGDYEARREVIEDVEDELRSYLISAKAGEVMQPFAASEGGYYLLRLKEKVEPRLAAEAIRHRVRRRLVEEAFATYLEQHVSWPEWQSNPPI